MCKMWPEPQRGYDLSPHPFTLCSGGTIGESDCLAGEPDHSALAARRHTTLLLAELRCYVEAVAQEVRIYQAMAETIEANCLEACHYVRAARAALCRLRGGREQVIA